MSEKPFFTPDQKKQIETLFCKDLNQDQVQHFITVCERQSLDPFAKQIFARAQNVNLGTETNPRWGKELVIITSIDGLRAIAEKSGEYRGQTPPAYYCLDDEGRVGWKDVWIGKGASDINIPEAARIGVHREGFKEALIRNARYHSFVQKTKKGEPTKFWRTMPDVMLLKCAEAAALRAAFPQLLGGMYIEEEISRQEADFEDEMNQEPAHHQEQLMGDVQQAAPVQKPAETAAKPPEPAKEPVTKKTTKATAKEQPKAKEEPAWASHVIAQVIVPRFKGRRLDDFTLDELTDLMEQWVEKYAEQRAAGPAGLTKEKADALPFKIHEAAMITEAFNARKKEQ